MARIVYVSWPAREIAGGIKVAFQHVSLLNACGFDAAVATEDGMRPTWFVQDVPVLQLSGLRPDDVLVLPENSHELLGRFAAAPQPRVVFCQNPFNVVRGLHGRLSYASYGVRHVMCVSQTVMRFFHLRMPDMKLGYTPYFVDSERFRPATVKRLQIACMPRKRRGELGIIRDLFLARHPEFRRVTWAIIDRMTEAQVAQVLGDSAVFLSLARFEAHSMSTLEAMACGCLAAGFTGSVGGNDSATVANGFWVAEDDVLGCAEQLGLAMQLAVDHGAPYRAIIESARQTAHDYRRESVVRLLAAYWRGTLADLDANPPEANGKMG